MRLRLQSLALLSELRMQRCRELWCRSQMWLGSGVAVAVAKAGSCSSDLTPSLGTSKCHWWGPKKKKKKKKERKKKRKESTISKAEVSFLISHPRWDFLLKPALTNIQLSPSNSPSPYNSSSDLHSLGQRYSLAGLLRDLYHVSPKSASR